jgi:hypothetical protein
MRFLSFWLRLTLLNMMISSSVHVLANDKILYTHTHTHAHVNTCMLFLSFICWQAPELISSVWTSESFVQVEAEDRSFVTILFQLASCAQGSHVSCFSFYCVFKFFFSTIFCNFQSTNLLLIWFIPNILLFSRLS